MIGYSRSPDTPPAAKLPKGQRWKCRGYSPVTGRPAGQDGHLQLQYVWEGIGQAPAAETGPTDAQALPQARRGIVELAPQADLFTD